MSDPIGWISMALFSVWQRQSYCVPHLVVQPTGNEISRSHLVLEDEVSAQSQVSTEVWPHTLGSLSRCRRGPHPYPVYDSHRSVVWFRGFPGVCCPGTGSHIPMETSLTICWAVMLSTFAFVKQKCPSVTSPFKCTQASMLCLAGFMNSK